MHTTYRCEDRAVVWGAIHWDCFKLLCISLKTCTKLARECKKPALQKVSNPRNCTQVKNIKKQISAQKQISRDGIYNLYAPALNIFPNLVSILSLKEILDMVNDLLTLQSDEFQIILTYDTTFANNCIYKNVKTSEKKLQRSQTYICKICASRLRQLMSTCPLFTCFHIFNHCRHIKTV